MFDCGAVADGVVHSELFGHTSGAFSGAERTRAGLVDEARGGTLLLDEVGDASPVLQSALLRLLEEGEVRAVGSNRVTRPDVRVVAATNRDVQHAVEHGRYRLDLWTRLSRWVVPVPPLTARREDIGLLLHRRAASHAGRPVRLAASFVETLTLHSFPGNVRELDALVERAAASTPPGEPLRLPPGWAPTAPGAEPEALPAGRGERPATEALVNALRAHGGNVTHVARALGAARHSVYRWCRELGVEPSDYRSNQTAG